MIKILFLLLVICASTLVVFFTTPVARYYYFDARRAYSYKVDLEKKIKSESNCKQWQTIDICFQNVIRQSGGFKSGEDFGIPLALLIFKLREIKGTTNYTFYKTMGLMVDEIHPVKFESFNKDRSRFLYDINQLKQSLEKNKDTAISALQRSADQPELKFELENLISKLDKKIVELGSY